MTAAILAPPSETKTFAENRGLATPPFGLGLTSSEMATVRKRIARTVHAADVRAYMPLGLPPEPEAPPSTPARTRPTTEPTREGTDEDISNLGCS